MNPCLFCRRSFELSDLNVDASGISFCDDASCQACAAAVSAVVRSLQPDQEGNMPMDGVSVGRRPICGPHTRGHVASDPQKLIH